MSSPIATDDDFSDRTSPMLVKELRQGLRAKTFIAMFLGLQVFLAVMLLSAGSTPSDRIGGTVSGIIFAFFALAVLVVQPLRGINALSSEIKGNTLDMMVLTRLSAWRIVYGKWLAIVSQSALLLSTLVPYLILRYFLGGMNLIGELVFLALMFLTSLTLTALTVALSGCSSVLVRFLLPIIGIPVMLQAIGVFVTFRSRSGNFFDLFGLGTPDSLWFVPSYCAGCVYLGVSLLSLGASLIAPAAENHAVIRRVVALALMVVLAALAFADVQPQAILLLVVVVAGPAIVFALTDSSRLVETVCLPFVKRGFVGKAAGYFFYPTWASGIIYSLVLGAISLILVFKLFSDLPGTLGSEESIAIVALWGGLFFPAVLQIYLFRGEGQRFGNYMMFQLLSCLSLAVLAMMAEATNEVGFLWLFCWNPLVFLAMLTGHAIEEDLVLISVVLINGGLVALLLARALRDFRRDRAVLQSAETMLVRRP